MPSQERPAQDCSPHQGKERRYQIEVVVQEAPSEANGTHRLDLLASLLSDALARQLGQGRGEEAGYSNRGLDYPATLSPTTDAQSTLPGEASQ